MKKCSLLLARVAEISAFECYFIAGFTDDRIFHVIIRCFRN